LTLEAIMKRRPLPIGLLAAWAALSAAAVAFGAESTRSVAIFEGQQVEVPVPAGWHVGERQDPRTGVQSVDLSDPGKDVALSISFMPDSRGATATRGGLETLARHVFGAYLDASVEKEMKLTYFEAPGGAGVYTSFTDGKLDPKRIPEGEKLISTTGLRSWKGGYLIFTLLTNTRDSAAYRKALDIVQSGLKVKLPVAF
jgi:hypothetical protein